MIKLDGERFKNVARVLSSVKLSTHAQVILSCEGSDKVTITVLDVIYNLQAGMDILEGNHTGKYRIDKYFWNVAKSIGSEVCLEFEKEFVILTSGKYTFKFRKGEDSTDFDESFEAMGKSVEVSGTELDKLSIVAKLSGREENNIVVKQKKMYVASPHMAIEMDTILPDMGIDCDVLPALVGLGQFELFKTDSNALYVEDGIRIKQRMTRPCVDIDTIVERMDGISESEKQIEILGKEVTRIIKDISLTGDGVIHLNCKKGFLEYTQEGIFHTAMADIELDGNIDQIYIKRTFLDEIIKLFGDGNIKIQVEGNVAFVADSSKRVIVSLMLLVDGEAA